MKGTRFGFDGNSFPREDGTKHWIFYFDNGYGASVVCGPHSYGGPEGLWELAVLYGNKIVHDTPIAIDVLGYLSDEDVEKKLKDIKALPPR